MLKYLKVCLIALAPLQRFIISTRNSERILEGNATSLMTPLRRATSDDR